MAEDPVAISHDILVAAFPAAEAAAEAPAAGDNPVPPAKVEAGFFCFIVVLCCLVQVCMAHIALQVSFHGVCCLQISLHSVCHLKSVSSWHTLPSSLFSWRVPPSELVFMACCHLN